MSPLVKKIFGLLLLLTLVACGSSDPGGAQDNGPGTDTPTDPEPSGLSTVRVSLDTNGDEFSGTGDVYDGSHDASISADGRSVAFWYGDAIHLHANGELATTRVDVSSSGEPANGGSADSAISADSRYIAFHSDADNLVAGDTNGTYDIFVHDCETGQTTRVSVASDGSESNGSSQGPVISADGRYVVFESSADNLVAGDNNGLYDIFVHDRETRETTRVNVASDGSEAKDINFDSGFQVFVPSISADGRYVAFADNDDNLVAGDVNGASDVFIHDRDTGETTRVSMADDGSEGNDGSWGPSISADGLYVAFASDADNLVPDDTNAITDVFVRKWK